MRLSRRSCFTVEMSEAYNLRGQWRSTGNRERSIAPILHSDEVADSFPRPVSHRVVANKSISRSGVWSLQSSLVNRWAAKDLQSWPNSVAGRSRSADTWNRQHPDVHIGVTNRPSCMVLLMNRWKFRRCDIVTGIRNLNETISISPGRCS